MKRIFNKGFFKRLTIVAGVGILIFAGVQLIIFIKEPRIRYSVKEVSCDAAAIAERNKALGSTSKACVIVINATNLDNKSAYVDYDGVGGGPLASWAPLIRIYTTGGRFCYGALNGDGSSFAPYATNELRPRCYDISSSGLSASDKAKYDEHSNENPIFIEFNTKPKTIIVLPRRD